MKYIVLSILLIASTADAGPFEHASGVVGLFYLPCAEESVKHIDIFASPYDKQPIGKLYYAEQIRTPDGEPICGKPTVHIENGRAGFRERHGELPLIYLKYSEGAVVLNDSNGWLEIRLDKGSAWVSAPDGKRYNSVEALLKGGMSYVLVAAPVPVQATPGQFSGIKPLRVRDQPQFDVKVLEFRNINGKLWAKIESSLNPCLDEYSIKQYKRQKPFSGWLPFHDVDGKPTLWFYSGGC